METSLFHKSWWPSLKTVETSHVNHSSPSSQIKWESREVCSNCQEEFELHVRRRRIQYKLQYLHWILTQLRLSQNSTGTSYYLMIGRVVRTILSLIRPETESTVAAVVFKFWTGRLILGIREWQLKGWRVFTGTSLMRPDTTIGCCSKFHRLAVNLAFEEAGIQQFVLSW